MGLTRPQTLQNRHRGETVRNEPAAGLEIPHRGARFQAEPPARLADVKAVADEVLLQFQPLGAASARAPRAARPPAIGPPPRSRSARWPIASA